MACSPATAMAETEASWDQVLSELDVLDIVDIFKLAHLYNVYIRLGLEDKDIENAKLRDIHSPEKQAQNIINIWRNRKGEEATRSALIEAIEKCPDCKHSLDTLKLKWVTAFDGPSPKKKGTEEPCYIESSFPVTLKTFRDELKEYYAAEMGQLPLLPWLEDHEMKHIDDIFVDLELATKKEKMVNYEDLVNIKHSTNKDRFSTRVLILGDAGSGKTSLMSRIAYSWSQDHQLRAQFELVFHLRMRNLHSCNNQRHCLRRGTSEEEQDTDCSLLGEIFQQMPETDVNVCDLQNYIKSNPSKILILLDGWDESVLGPVDLDKSKVKKAEHDIENLLIGKKQPSSCVIVTSRPYRSLGKVQSQLYTSVNLKGFSGGKVTEYIRKFFQDEDKIGDLNMAERLIEHLETSDTLENLAKIPVMLMLICWMWSDPKMKSLPKYRTELYSMFVSAIWARYCDRFNVHRDEDATKVERKKNIALQNLGDIAFKGLLPTEETLVFEKSQMQTSVAVIGLKLGLLIEEKSTFSRHNVSSNAKSVSFFHKSFQEFCAAFFLVNNPDELNKFLNSLDSWNAVLRKQEVLVFCCGLCSKFPGNTTAVNVIKHAIACCVRDGTTNNDGEINIGVPRSITRASGSTIKYNILPVLNLLNECDQINHEALIEPFVDLIMFDKLSIHNSHPQTQPVFHQFVTSKLGDSLCNIQEIKFTRLTCASLKVASDTLRRMPNVSYVNMRMFSLDDTCVICDSRIQLCESIAALPKLSRLTVLGAPIAFYDGLSTHLDRSPSSITPTQINFGDYQVVEDGWYYSLL